MENKYYIDKQNVLTENIKKAVYEMNYNVRILSKEVDLLEEKIDKAIEYIKNNIDNTGWLEIGSSNVNELLEILGDKNDRKNNI